MNPNSFWKQILGAFVLALVGYVIVFGWIENRRRKNGPWEVIFTSADNTPTIVINHARLQLTNISIAFIGAETRTNLPQTVQFEHGRPAPFDLPFGKCEFVDVLFLPGTAACEMFGHQIQLMPRTLTIDGVEHPWSSGEKILLTNRTPVTLPAR